MPKQSAVQFEIYDTLNKEFYSSSLRFDTRAKAREYIFHSLDNMIDRFTIVVADK